MDATATAAVLPAFDDLPDPRTGNHVRHELHDLVAIAVMAVVRMADGRPQVRLWAESKAAWLATFLDLPGGIPDHDTFGRVFARLDSDAFEWCFTAWIGGPVGLTAGRLVAIDGKAIRRGFAPGRSTGRGRRGRDEQVRPDGSADASAAVRRRRPRWPPSLARSSAAAARQCGCT